MFCHQRWDILENPKESGENRNLGILETHAITSTMNVQCARYALVNERATNINMLQVRCFIPTSSWVHFADGSRRLDQHGNSFCRSVSFDKIDRRTQSEEDVAFTTLKTYSFLRRKSLKVFLPKLGFHCSRLFEAHNVKLQPKGPLMECQSLLVGQLLLLEPQLNMSSHLCRGHGLLVS